MSYPTATNPVIDSGIVEAPSANSNSHHHQSSPTTAAPSQATQEDSTTSTYGNQTNHPSTSHHLNAHAYDTGTGNTTHPAGRRPFQPMGTTHQEEQQHVNPPPLPPREDGGPVQHMPMRTDGIGNADSGAGVGAGVESHGPPHLRRGDYASGAAGENTQTHAGHNTHPETTSTGANVNAGSGAGGAGVEKRSTGAKVRESASGVKGLVAAVHGAGETLRGTFNKEVDRAFHDKEGEIKNDRIARQGEVEIQEGRFAKSTKNREGVVPGSDGERRSAV